MPVQKLIFLRDWYKPGAVMKARPVDCPEEPDRIWTLWRETDESKPPALPFVPCRRTNAFAEDYVHDWNWSRGRLDYFSRVADGPVWILLEYDTQEEKQARLDAREAIRQRLRGKA